MLQSWAIITPLHLCICGLRHKLQHGKSSIKTFKQLLVFVHAVHVGPDVVAAPRTNKRVRREDLHHVVDARFLQEASLVQVLGGHVLLHDVSVFVHSLFRSHTN